MTYDVIAAGGRVPGVRTLDRPLIGATFDDESHLWTLQTDAGRSQTRVLLDCGSPLVPWLPPLAGAHDFHGQCFHATMIADNFDPAARRVAVIGGDSTAGRLIGTLTRSGAAVTVFPLPPRRVVRPIGRARRYLRRQPDVVTAPIETVTASGIRTADGSRHAADTIIFGTGFSAAAEHPALTGAGGRTLAQAWRDGAEPYFGVAVHGFPNYFMVGGPPHLEARQRCVAECLQLLGAHTRIEVRRSSQQVFNERAHLHPPSHQPFAAAFDVSTAGDSGDLYDGPATLTLADDSQRVRVRLSGRVDPIDGQYHWQGTVFDAISDDLVRARSLTVNVGECSASARITEQTQQGRHSIAGTGAPPFALPALEVS